MLYGVLSVNLELPFYDPSRCKLQTIMCMNKGKVQSCVVHAGVIINILLSPKKNPNKQNSK